MFSFELHCSNCGWRTVSGVDDAIARLRLIGLLRRDREPDEDVVAALLVEATPRMTCPLCKEKRLTAEPTTDAADAADWQAAILCEVCRQPIDPERLDAIPGTKRCACLPRQSRNWRSCRRTRLLPELRRHRRNSRQPR